MDIRGTSLVGTVSRTGNLAGLMSKTKRGVNGKSAYEIAVDNGFEGTEEEWLKSLEADTPELEALIKRAEDVLDQLTDYADKTSPSRIAYVSIYADKWEGTTSPFYQVVEVEGATNRTQVDLTPNAEQLEMCREKELALCTINRNGVVRVKAVGQKPANDYYIQVTLTDVSDVPENGEIIGVTVGTSMSVEKIVKEVEENISITTDPELDVSSSNPIQNMAVTQKINEIETTVGNIDILLGTI